ncbi:MAG: DUF2007 domain-containing protein [Marinicaulis sp.]|nr:DUF2007 domain-containing protein [Marinicaulis sp.]NNL88401.1 DUF2007 domain-containing protein [Marinicaulis sp.]
MIELLRTDAPASPSFVKSLTDCKGVHYFVADQTIHNVEGSLSIFPIRVMITEDDFNQAQKLMKDAGLQDLLMRK